MAAIVAVLISLAPAAARAEDIATYETEGESEVTGGDARVAALDDAFARAVAQALADVVDPAARKAHRSAIQEHIVGRARLWVAKFTVTKDATSDGRRQLTVAVRVDRDKLRARLGELGIAIAGSSTSAPGGEAARPGAKSVVILLRTTDGVRARATYGATAEKELPGLGALAAALRTDGMAPKRASAAGPAVRADGELPLDDQAADALAAEAKADFAAIASANIGESVEVRGVPASAVLVTANLRLIAAGRRLVGHGVATAAASGPTSPLTGAVIDAAIERALVAAAGDVVTAKPQVAPARPYTGDDAPIGEPGVVLVRLAAKTPWGLVAAEQKWLAGAKGVQRAVLRRASPSGWVIGVTTTESIERIAQILRKPPASGASVNVRIAGDIVEVALAEAP